MSESLPSRPLTIIDVPEVKSFKVEFQYNYHVPNEGSEQNGGIPEFAIERSGEGLDTSFIQYSTSRVPRFVKLSWAPVDFSDVFDPVYGDVTGKSSVVEKGYIKNNIKKIISEETYANLGFTSVTFTDQSIDRKLYHEISSSIAVLNEEYQQASKLGIMLKTNDIKNDSTDFDSISKYYSQPSEDGVFYYGKEGERIKNNAVNKLKDFYLPAQINSKFLRSLTRRSMLFSESTYESSYASLYDLTKDLEIAARKNAQVESNVNDYTSYGEHVSLKHIHPAYLPPSGKTRVVGYIIEKNEVMEDGSSVKLESIFVENPLARLTIDPNVKYYSQYQYTIRTVAEFIIPTVVEDTSSTVLATFLISSRPSSPLMVNCMEMTPPPPPTEFGGKFDRSDNTLFLHWKFPVNSQRDIKQIQLFRRKSVYEPFQLIFQNDFDDSTVKANYMEKPSGLRVIKGNNPILSYHDSDFGRGDKFIYALASIDAHGMTSGYSEQLEISFDTYKNKLIVKRISNSGAPKAHPNLYLNMNLYRQSIKSAGKTSMSIAFSPEQTKVLDSDNNDLRVIKTVDENATYLIQGINTDVGKSATVEISISNRAKKLLV